MTELLVITEEVLLAEVQQDIALLEEIGEVEFIEVEVENVITEVAMGNDLITVTQEVVLLTEGVQGPPGGAIEPSLLIDASRPIAYAGFTNRIKRLNYSSYPPVINTVLTADLNADWPNRASLNYT